MSDKPDPRIHKATDGVIDVAAADRRRAVERATRRTPPPAGVDVEQYADACRNEVNAEPTPRATLELCSSAKGLTGLPTPLLGLLIAAENDEERQLADERRKAVAELEDADRRGLARTRYALACIVDRIVTEGKTSREAAEELVHCFELTGEDRVKLGRQRQADPIWIELTREGFLPIRVSCFEHESAPSAGRIITDGGPWHVIQHQWDEATDGEPIAYLTRLDQADRKHTFRDAVLHSRRVYQELEATAKALEQTGRRAVWR